MENEQFSNEQKDIYESFQNFLDKVGLKKENDINYELNYIYKLSNNEEIEFDLVFILKLKNKINIFIIEHQTYADEISIVSPVTNDIESKKNKIKKFRDDLLLSYRYNKKENIDIYLIFSYKKSKQDDEIILNLFKINEKKIKKIDINYFKEKIKYKKQIPLTLKIIDNIRNTPRDIQCIMNSFKESREAKKILNNSITSKISNSIQKGYNIFFINGPAGSGKTNLICSWFSEYLRNGKQCILFFINKYFVKQIKNRLDSDGLQKYSKLIVWHSYDFSHNTHFFENDGKKYIFIDEAQRLNDSNWEFIYSKSNDKNNVFFLFGDKHQKIGISDTNHSSVKKMIPNIVDLKIQKYYRIGKDNFNFILYIFFSHGSPNKIKKPTIDIVIKDNIDDFFDLFDNDKSWKVMCSTEGVSKNLENSMQRSFSPAYKEMPSRDLFLYNNEYLNNYYFYAYDVISREIESIYIYLPNEMCIDNHFIFKESYDDRIINQFYVLLTRATKKIVVCVNNNDYYKNIKERMDKFYEK